METPLLFLIVLLSGAICALAGFWFYRSARERRKSGMPARIGRRAGKHDPWEDAVRAFRDKA